MATEIKVGRATIDLTGAEFHRSANAITLAVGRCKTGDFLTRSGETVTFFPQVGPFRPRLMRRVLDAIDGPKGFKIEHLEAHLSAMLGSFEYLFDPAIFQRFRECYDWKGDLFVTYVRCDASIGSGKGKIAFTIDFPVGAFVRVTGKPVCCPDRGDLYEVIGPDHAPPAEAVGKIARKLYDEAVEAEKKRRRRIEELLKKDLEWKLELDGKYRLDPRWGFDFKYDEDAKKGKDKPIFRVKPKFGF